MFSSTVRKTAEAVTEAAPIDPAELVTLAELATEGFGWGSPYVTSPRDAIDELARQLDGEVVLDDIGRRCTDRETARALFAERAEAERRQREAQQRRAELHEQAANNRPRGGVPADRIPDGVSPAAAMLQAALDAEPRRQSVLEEALANRGGAVVYHPISDREES